MLIINSFIANFSNVSYNDWISDDTNELKGNSDGPTV